MAIDEVKRFVSGTRNQTAEQLEGLARSPRRWSTSRMDLEQVLHVTPNSFANAYNIYDPDTGTVRGGFSIPNLASPMQFVCGMIGATQNTTAPETAKLCNDYLGPALRLLNLNYIPVPISPYLAKSASPDNIVYADPKLAPGGEGGCAESAGDAARGLGVHRTGRRRAAASRHGTAAGVPFSAPDRRQNFPIPALYPGAPVPTDPPQIGPPVPPAASDASPAAPAAPEPAGHDASRRSAATALHRARCCPLRRSRPSRLRRWDTAVMMSGVRWDADRGRLFAAGTCVALTATGCAFQGVNSLPLPGAVGRGSDAVTYHVQIANVATLESNSPVLMNDVVVGSVGKMDVQDWHANVEISVKPDVAIPANAVASVGQTSLLGLDASGAESATGPAARGQAGAGRHHRAQRLVDLPDHRADAVVAVGGRERGRAGPDR